MKVRISRFHLRQIPDCLEISIGEPRGEIRQFRGKYNMHMHEYKKFFEIHRDRDIADPRLDL
jgi:hypothetical protein